ncbi:MAG: DUF58 domain-containing protein [Kiritimatiellae bacterium]|jgi:uncharacterized protein (DUF58 family)|nr:DUF58 domain-containing protein [Kiritimatiellia bacterium]
MISKELLRKIRGIEIRTRHLVTDVLAGQYHSAFKGAGMEFEEVREYQPGDDIRSIDWNVTARTGHPFIKTFREERELTVLLVVDMSASLRFGSGSQLKQEIAAEIAALLALAAIRNQDNVALLLHTDQVERYIPAGKGSRHVLRVVREILGFDPASTGTDLRPALTFLNRVTHRKSVVFLIGDGQLEASSLEAARLTARRHDVISIRLEDPRESDWRPVGLIDWLDPETGEYALVDTSSPRVRKALQEQHRLWTAEQDQTLRRGGIDSVSISTSEAYERTLAHFFRIRAKRRGK